MSRHKNRADMLLLGGQSLSLLTSFDYLRQSEEK